MPELLLLLLKLPNFCPPVVNPFKPVPKLMELPAPAEAPAASVGVGAILLIPPTFKSELLILG